MTVVAIAAALLAGAMIYQLSLSTATAYAVTAFVSDIDTDAGTITFEDADGNLWTVDSGEEWEIGDVATILLEDGGTPDKPEDDTIIFVEQSGFTLD